MRLFGLPALPRRNEGGDERWLITYADMITLLLVLFIIMYATANTDLEKFKALAEAISEGFGATSEGRTGQGGGGASIIFDTSGGGTSPVELFPEKQVPIHIFDFQQMLEGQGQQSGGEGMEENLGETLAQLAGEAIADAQAGGQLPEGLVPGGIDPEQGLSPGDIGLGQLDPGQGMDQGETGAGQLDPGAGQSPGDIGAGQLDPGAGQSPGDVGAGQLDPGAGMNEGDIGAGQQDNVGQGPDVRDLGAGIDISYNERGIVISIFPDQILFDSGSARLKPKFKEILAALAPALIRLPNVIEVDGHTDNVPINTLTYPSNWELSAGRAGSAGRHLIGLGLPRDRLQVAGYADTRPVSSNDTVKGRARNRRVEIVVLREGNELMRTTAPGTMPEGEAMDNLGEEFIPDNPQAGEPSEEPQEVPGA